MLRFRWVPFWLGVVVAVAAMAIFSAAVLAGSEGPDPRAECTWGASSQEAVAGEDGGWVVSEAETSGCVPGQPEAP